MADIVIPSSHIYEMENPKILNNLIKNVSFVESTYVVSSADLYKANEFSTTQAHYTTYFSDWAIDGKFTRYRYAIVADYQTTKIFISSQHSLLYETLTPYLTITTSGNVVENIIEEKRKLSRKTMDYTIDESTIPKPFQLETTDFGKFCNTLIRTKMAYTLETVDLYSVYINITFLNSIESYLQTNHGYMTEDGMVWEEDFSNEKVDVNPIIIQKNLDVKSNYNSTTSETITVGSKGNSFKLYGNELLQSNTKKYKSASDETGEKIANFLSNKILSKYANGKECAVLLCSIGDYYDVNGQKQISASDNSFLPMTFKIGDNVIPYVFSSSGKDRPMSKNRDGTSKRFRVVGMKIFYDGAVWQEISLQER